MILGPECCAIQVPLGTEATHHPDGDLARFVNIISIFVHTPNQHILIVQFKTQIYLKHLTTPLTVLLFFLVPFCLKRDYLS